MLNECLHRMDAFDVNPCKAIAVSLSEAQAWISLAIMALLFTAWLRRRRLMHLVE
jgi:hypothetical protein